MFRQILFCLKEKKTIIVTWEWWCSNCSKFKLVTGVLKAMTMLTHEQIPQDVGLWQLWIKKAWHYTTLWVARTPIPQLGIKGAPSWLRITVLSAFAQQSTWSSLSSPPFSLVSSAIAAAVAAAALQWDYCLASSAFPPSFFHHLPGLFWLTGSFHPLILAAASAEITISNTGAKANVARAEEEIREHNQAYANGESSFLEKSNSYEFLSQEQFEQEREGLLMPGECVTFL